MDSTSGISSNVSTAISSSEATTTTAAATAATTAPANSTSTPTIRPKTILMADKSSTATTAVVSAVLPAVILGSKPTGAELRGPCSSDEARTRSIGSWVGGDMVAALGEATATPYFIYRLRDAMLVDATGRRILRERPRMTSTTLSLAHLRTLPDESVGRTYAAWLDGEGVSPDTREAVRYIDDEECAYVMQRYRECHDFYHALTGLPVMVEGEVALKAFEFANTLLPMTGLSTLAVFRLRREQQWARFFRVFLPWALENGLKAKEIINVYWEEQLERNVDDLRAELGIEKPIDLREMRRLAKQRKQSQRAADEPVSADGDPNRIAYKRL
ncbi:MAG: Ubiquinone biosynthesis protein [Lichina confinis]|nr:MAG: Ubiquinone biosynthesis protein [Lichina confinis]